MQKLALVLSFAFMALSTPVWAAPPATKTKPAPQSGTKPHTESNNLAQDTQAVREHIKVARMWLQQKDGGEAIYQIRNAIRRLGQMQSNLIKPVQRLTDTGRKGSLLDAKGKNNLQALEKALAELTAYANPMPTAQQTRVTQMKGYLAKAHEHLKSKNEKGAKDALRLIDIELAAFELDLPVTYAEVRLRQAYRLILDGALLPADQELQAVEKNFLDNPAKAIITPAQ